MKIKNILLVLGCGALMSSLSADTLDLMDGSWRGSALKKTTSEVKKGNFSYRWDAFDSSYFIIDSFETQDWLDYSKLTLWLYSEEDNEAEIAIGVFCKTQTEESGHSYYVHRITVDWEGWKEMEIDFSDFIPVRSPLGWSDVSYVKVMSNYGADRIPGTILYFNDLKLED